MPDYSNPRENPLGVIVLGGLISLFVLGVVISIADGVFGGDDNSSESTGSSYDYTTTDTYDDTGSYDAPTKAAVPDRVPNHDPDVQRWKFLVCTQLDNLTFEEVWQGLRVDEGLTLGRTDNVMVGSIESHCPRHIRYVR